MKLYWVLAGAALLAACDNKAPPPAVAVSDTAPEATVMGAEQPILAIGDSLFAGYGLEEGESYPAKLEKALRARGVNARISNAGVSGDTTAGGLQRLEFTLNSQKVPPVLAIISLGGNDLLRGLPPEQTRANLTAIVDALQKRKIKVVLMGMLAPPNYGADYRKAFDGIYPALMRQKGVGLVPFFLQAVIDKPDLVQADHIHPTARGIEEIVGATVAEVAGALPSAPTPAPPPPG